jgi:hypothetical protein
MSNKINKSQVNSKQDIKRVETQKEIGKAKNGHIAHTPPPKPGQVPKK